MARRITPHVIPSFLGVYLLGWILSIISSIFDSPIDLGFFDFGFFRFYENICFGFPLDSRDCSDFLPRFMVPRGVHLVKNAADSATNVDINPICRLSIPFLSR